MLTRNLLWMDTLFYSQTCSVIQPRCLTSIPGCMTFIASFTLGKRWATLACMALYQDWAMAGSFARRNMEFFLLDETTSKYLQRREKTDSIHSAFRHSEADQRSSWADQILLRRSERLCYLFSVSGGHCFRDTWHIFRGMLRGSFTSLGKGSQVLWGEEGGESHGRAPPGEPELLKKADISLMYFTGVREREEDRKNWGRSTLGEQLIKIMPNRAILWFAVHFFACYMFPLFFSL